MSALATCCDVRDELRHDVISGEWYETGYALGCMRPVEPGLPFCASHTPRSANRNAPYIVRSGQYLGSSEEHTTFDAALASYAACRAAGQTVELTGAKVDLEDDGLDDDERELLGMVP